MSKKGYIWITDGKKQKQIDLKQLSDYRRMGWCRGRLEKHNEKQRVIASTFIHDKKTGQFLEKETW